MIKPDFHGWEIRSLELKSGEAKYKSCSSHQLDLLQLVSGSKPQLWLQIANWSAYCQLEFLTCGVYFSCLFIDPKRYERNLHNQELQGANSWATEIYSRLPSQNFQGSIIKRLVSDNLLLRGKVLIWFDPHFFVSKQ